MSAIRNLLLILVALGLAGCGQEAEDTPAASEPSASEIEAPNVVTAPEDEANVTLLLGSETEDGEAFPVISVDGAILPPRSDGEPITYGYHNLHLDPGSHEISAVQGDNPPDTFSFNVGEDRVWVGVIHWGENGPADTTPITEFHMSDAPIAGDSYLEGN